MSSDDGLVAMKDIKRILTLLSLICLGTIWTNALTSGHYHYWILAALVTPIFGLLYWEVRKRGQKT